MAISGPRLLSVKDAATYLGLACGDPTIGPEQGIALRSNGRKYLIDRMDLDRFVERNKIGVAA